MAAEIPLIDIRNISFTGADFEGVILKAIWGMYGLRRCAVKNNDERMLERMNESLSQLLERVKGWGYSSDAYLIRALKVRGIISHGAQVMCFLRPSSWEYKEKEMDTEGLLAIGFAGMIRAGKSLAGKIVEEEYEGAHFPFVDSLKAFSLAMGYKLGMSRAGLREVNDIIKPRFGNATFAEETVRRATALIPYKQPLVLGFDGFRSAEEARLILSLGGVMAEVWANLDTRYLRAKQHVSEDKKGQEPESLEHFKHESELEYETMMRPAIELCQIRLDNNQDDLGERLRVQIKTHFDPMIHGI